MWIEFSSQIVIPKAVALRDGELFFDYGRGNSLASPVTPRSTLWREFLDLDGEDDRVIHEFARKHGALLGIDRSNWYPPAVPFSSNSVADPARSASSERTERIELWRSSTKLLIEIHSGLGQLGDGGATPDRPTICASINMMEAPKIVEGRMSVLATVLNKAFGKTQPHLSFGWRKNRFTVGLSTDSVWATVVVQVANQFLGERHRRVPCDGCDRLIAPRPHSGKRQFCNQCRVNGVPMKLAMRDMRKRLKRAQAGTRERYTAG